MAAEYLAPGQTVLLNAPVTFQDATPCRRGYVCHESGSGIFVLRGLANRCRTSYKVELTGNIAVPEGGTVGPIALALTVNGEQRAGSRAITTPAAVDEYGNVTSVATVKVPRGCCFTLAARYVNGNTDPTATPTPAISLADGNLNIDITD